MFERIVIPILPIFNAVIYGLVYAWFCGHFGQHRWKYRYISTLGIILFWALVEKIPSSERHLDFLTIILMNLLGVVIRIILAWIFYRMSIDKLLFVSLSYSSAYSVAHFIIRRLMGSDKSLSLSITIARGLGLSGDMFFLLNKLLLSANILLVDMLRMLLIWLYCRMVCAALKDKVRRFRGAELAFLLLPSLVVWLERLALYILLYEDVLSEPVEFEGFSIVVTITVFAMLLLLALSVINIYTYQRMVDALRERSNRIILERQNADMQRHLEDIMRLNNDIRSTRHDMKNHIAVLTQLASDIDSHEELKEYLAEMSNHTGQLDVRFSTGLPAIDALMAGKDGEAIERLGEDFSIRVENLIFPKGLLIHEYDIAVILGNALDNAIEACEKSKSEPFIELSSGMRGNMLLLEIRNSFTGKLKKSAESDFPLTSKEDYAEHGIGFHNMKTTAEKYHGAVDWRVENGQFILTVLLQNEKPER